jgi:hypothetical protein
MAKIINLFLLDYQDYPIKAAKNASMNRRTLGIGVTNLAYYLAKNGAKYSDGSGNDLDYNDQHFAHRCALYLHALA